MAGCAMCATDLARSAEKLSGEREDELCMYRVLYVHVYDTEAESTGEGRGGWPLERPDATWITCIGRDRTVALSVSVPIDDLELEHDEQPSPDDVHQVREAACGRLRT